MRGGDNADVYFARDLRAYGLDFLVLDGAKELGLGGERHVTDLVEEKGASTGELEEAGFVSVGSGEGAADVSEEFAFEESFDNGAAVEDDELAADPAAAMESGGDEVFACAGRAFEKNGTVVGGDALDHAEEVPHDVAAGDEAFELEVVERGVGGGVGVEPARGGGDEVCDAVTEDGDLYGFVEVVGGAEADGGDGGFGGVVRGHEDDVDGGVEGDDALEDFEAGHFGHDEVGDD